MIRVNNLRIYQSMMEHGLGIREACVLARVNDKTLKKMLTGLMVRIDAVRRLSQALEIPVHELLILSRGAPPFQKQPGDRSVNPSLHS